MELDKNKITLVLDLDETLVHCTPLDSKFDIKLHINISKDEII